MDTRQTGDPAVRNLERRIRFEIEKLLLITTIVCLGLEIALATYYYLIRDLGQPLNTYIEFRILLPCGINVILYLFTRFSNRSENSTDSTKNRICSIALLLITGVISLAHSYFIPLWMLPLFVVMFCSVFQDDFIQKVLAGFSFVIILYSGILHLYDYPTERTFTIICIVIAEVMTVAISFTSFKMETYIVRMFLIAARGSATGGNGAETDRVTGVYSKSFLISEAEKMLSEAKELEPCGFAVLDIDDFRTVNDSMGHDKGDDVLRALGSILAAYIDDETIIGRYGGEKFVVVFADGIQEEHIEMLEQMRKEFAQKKYSFTEKSITISGGYVWYDTKTEFEKAVSEAEEALARAKKSGKNKIVSRDESED